MITSPVFALLVPLTASPVQAVASTAGEMETAGHIVDLSVLIVAGVTIVFTAALALLAIFEWRRFGEVTKSFEAQRDGLKTEAASLERDVATERAAIQKLKGEVAEGLKLDRRYLQALICEYSGLLVGIVDGIASTMRADAPERKELRRLIFEAESAVALFHPDSAAVWDALARLEQVGLDASVAPLARLRDDSSAPAEVRLRAQAVLARVVGRVREASKASAPTKDAVLGSAVKPVATAASKT